MHPACEDYWFADNKCLGMCFFVWRAKTFVVSDDKRQAGSAQRAVPNHIKQTA